MKAKRLEEIQALLAEGGFRGWFEDLTDLRRRLAEVNDRFHDLQGLATLERFRAEQAQKLGTDRLYDAGEEQDGAAILLAEAADFENKSYATLADFEQQRTATSEAWYQAGAAEHHFEERQAEVEFLSKQQGEGHEVKRLNHKLEEYGRAYRQKKEEYERQEGIKQQIWEQVELYWNRSLELHLASTEKKMESRRCHRVAEWYFMVAEEHKQRAAQMAREIDELERSRTELKAQIDDLIERARINWDCIATERFLYWQQRDDNKRVYIAPLIEDQQDFNVPVIPLQIYEADSREGVGALATVADLPRKASADR